MSLFLAMMKTHRVFRPGGAATPEGPKALILISESISGAEEGFNGLDLLRRKGYQLFPVASAGALRCWGRERLLSLTGPDGIASLEERGSADLGEGPSLVYLPVVSPGLLGKLAHGIYDEPLASLIFQAQMKGVPVIGAVEAVEADDPSEKGMNRLPRGLARILRENRERVAGQGIALIPVSRIARELAGRLGLRIETGKARSAGPDLLRRRRVITRADLAGLENSALALPADTLLTALAREYAAEKGIQITIHR